MEKKLTNWVFVALSFILANVIMAPYLLEKAQEQPISHGDSIEEIIVEEEIETSEPSEGTTLPKKETYVMNTGKQIVELAMQSFENALTINAKTTGTATTNTLGQTVIQDVLTYNKVDANGVAILDTKSTKKTTLGMSVWRKANYNGSTVSVSGSDYSSKNVSKNDYVAEYGGFIGDFPYVIDCNDPGVSFSKPQSAVLGVLDETTSSIVKVKTKFTTVTFSKNVSAGESMSPLQKAVENYAHYVNTMSGTKNYPVFNSVKLTIYVGTDDAGDFAGQIVKYKVVEEYKLKVVAGETVTNDIQTTYQTFKNYFML